MNFKSINIDVSCYYALFVLPIYFTHILTQYDLEVCYAFL